MFQVQHASYADQRPYQLPFLPLIWIIPYHQKFSREFARTYKSAKYLNTNLQKEISARTLRFEISKQLAEESEKRELMLSKYAILREALGTPGVYGRVAKAILQKTG